MKIIRKPEVDNNWLSPEIECRTCRTVYQGDRLDIYYRDDVWRKRLHGSTLLLGYYYLVCPVCGCQHELDESIIPWDLIQR